MTNDANHREARSFPFLSGALWLARNYVKIEEPFIWDEWYARLIGAEKWNQPIVHVWQVEDALVLGLMERELPTIERSVQVWKARGRQVMVRNSGGAAVRLDAGVVNVSVILPARPGSFEIEADFEQFAKWLEATLPQELKFERGEVCGAYCPGSYDLSFQGKKICGLAQRRPLRARIWHGFVNVSGDARKRAEEVADFYRLAGADARADQVDPQVMGSLADFSATMNVRSWLQVLRETLPPEAFWSPDSDWLAGNAAQDSIWVKWRQIQPSEQEWTEWYREMEQKFGI